MKIHLMTETARLREIAEIIEGVDRRAMAADGPIGDTREEMTDKEMRRIYVLAVGHE